MVNWKSIIEIFFSGKWRLSAIQYRFFILIIDIPYTIRYLFIANFNWLSSIITLLIIYIVYSIINICLSIQRAHDLWWSWWKILLLLIPIYNIYIALCLSFKGGIEWKNEYWDETEATIAFIVVTILMVVSVIIFWISIFDDYKNYSEIEENHSIRELSNPEILELSIYNPDFLSETNDKYIELMGKELCCTNCSLYTLIKKHEKLKKVYNEYENFKLELSKNPKYTKKK